MTDNLRNVFTAPSRLFLIAGAFFGLIAVFMMPVLTAPDEGAHLWTSYGMFSKNEQIPKDLLVPAETSVKTINDGSYVHGLFKVKANLSADGYRLNYRKPIHTNRQIDSHVVSSFDLAHLPQAIGILIGRLVYPSVGVMVTLGRLANLVFYLGAMYLIIKHVKHGQLTFMFIALFPMLIQQAASLSYDAFNAVAIFAWVALMINLFSQTSAISRRQLLLLSGIAIGLIAAKPSNILLFAFIPFLPPALFRHFRLSRWLTGRLSRIDNKIMLRRIWFSVGVIFCLLGLVFTYKYLHIRGIGGSHFISVLFNTFFRPEVNHQLDSIVTSGLVGNFGWLWYRLPEWIVILQLIVFTFLLLGEKPSMTSKLLSRVSIIIFLSSIIFISLGMYFLWTLRPYVGGTGADFIQGIQGRYFTPLLVLLIPSFAYLRRYISVEASREALTKLAITMSVLSLSIYTLLTYIFFYTYTTGVKDILLK